MMCLFSNILSALYRELRDMARDRLYLVSLVVIPPLALLFYVVAFGSGSIERLPIVVVDESNTPSSRRLVAMLTATRGVAVAGYAASASEGEAAVRRGEAYGFVVIDEAFERDIYAGRSADVEVLLSGVAISASGVLERDIRQAVMTFAAGVELERLRMLGLGEHQAMVELSPVTLHTHIISNPYLNYGFYLAPTFMAMSVVISLVLATRYAVGRELRYATVADWLASASGSLPAALIGKLLPVTVWFVVVMHYLYLLLFVVMGMECSGSYLLLSLGSLLFVLAYQCVAIAIIAVVANLRLAMSLGGGYAVMAFTFSGITFPVMAMWGVARLLSYLFPLGYFVNIFVSVAMRGLGAEYVAKDMLALALFVLAVPLVWRRICRVVSDKRYLQKD